MSEHSGPWSDAWRGWDRLSRWYVEGDSAAGSAEAALDALADVGLVRRLLDQAELAAVRTARREGRSWTEIAVQLGITRQSAWERWRDLDDSGPAEAIAGAARELRRRSSVRVPDVVGLLWDDARQVLHGAGLVAVGPDPDGPPLAAEGWPNGVVTDQSPEAGAKVPSGSPVTVWIERGGGSGVREPRVPKPTPLRGRAMRDEPSDEAVG